MLSCISFYIQIFYSEGGGGAKPEWAISISYHVFLKEIWQNVKKAMSI